ncbi:hypothetical protein E4Z66_05585 [Aliishimia ponticola]|uniref:Uncharacterized protein n=1 Tax=Aliishimia ponticola TaxID=2499833 RepID=A0A4S4NHA1_9RHOB|nr:hypothetical protein [Aliishimia ponticola]THH39029.1 hypothetical protein E4Z66_05585 [Aliishimia ponticola]
MTPAPYRFTRAGRSWTGVVSVAVVWALVAAAWLRWDISPWIGAVLLAFTLPALWDLWRGTTAGLRLDDSGLHWHSGRRAGHAALDEIAHMRLVTRLDLSVRAAIVLTSGRKLRLPAEATPPAQDFEAALTTWGITAQRHHFTAL